MASLPFAFDTQFFANDGAVAASYLLYTYEDGTTTPKSTYTDAAAGTPNPNPITLNTAGRCNLWLGAGSYSFELKTPAGTLIKRWDGVSTSSTLDSLGDEASSSAGAGLVGYNATLSYANTSIGARLLDRISVKDYPFAATGDGVTDDRAAFIAAIAEATSKNKALYIPKGTYYFSDSISPANGTQLILIGEHRDLVTIKAAAGKIPFYCNQTVGVNNRISGAYIEGITFDGGHIRTPASYPYGGDTGSSITQALNLRGTKGEGDRGDVVITRCRFKDINGLPVWIADFDGSVEFSFNHLYRVKDPGFLYNDDVKVICNTIEFAADNGISVSRSNKRVTVAFNHIRDCASSGIFIGGVNVTGSGANLTVSGASYTVGSSLAVSSSGTTFGTEDVGINFTLRSGSDVAVVRITDVSANNSATATAITAVPATLQGISTGDWSRGPVSGAQAGGVYANVIEGASNYGVHLSAGCKDLTISDNQIRRTGITRDSEVSTTGTILAGSTSLAVASATNFAINDWVVIDPDYTSEDYFIAQVTNIVGTTFTLSAAPTQSLIGEKVYRAYRRTAAYGILGIGSFENATVQEYAENLKIHGNTIVDSVTGGIRLGSSSGAVRDSQVYANQIILRQSAHVEATVYGILVGDVGSTDMRTVRLDIHSNTISLNNAALSFGVFYRPIDTNANSYIRIDRNRIRQCVTPVRVQEQTGSTDITSTYMPTVHSSALTNPDVVNADTFAPTTWATATVNATTMTLTQTLNTYTPGAPTTITDVVTSGINHGTPILVIRNASAANAITFTFNASKIRTKTGADVVVPAYGSIAFAQISAGLVQQIG